MPLLYDYYFILAKASAATLSSSSPCFTISYSSSSSSSSSSEHEKRNLLKMIGKFICIYLFFSYCFSCDSNWNYYPIQDGMDGLQQRHEIGRGMHTCWCDRTNSTVKSSNCRTCNSLPRKICRGAGTISSKSKNRRLCQPVPECNRQRSGQRPELQMCNFHMDIQIMFIYALHIVYKALKTAVATLEWPSW